MTKATLRARQVAPSPVSGMTYKPRPETSVARPPSSGGDTPSPAGVVVSSGRCYQSVLVELRLTLRLTEYSALAAPGSSQVNALIASLFSAATSDSPAWANLMAEERRLIAVFAEEHTTVSDEQLPSAREQIMRMLPGEQQAAYATFLIARAVNLIETGDEPAAQGLLTTASATGHFEPFANFLVLDTSNQLSPSQKCLLTFIVETDLLKHPAILKKCSALASILNGDIDSLSVNSEDPIVRMGYALSRLLFAEAADQWFALCDNSLDAFDRTAYYPNLAVIAILTLNCSAVSPAQFLSMLIDQVVILPLSLNTNGKNPFCLARVVITTALELDASRLNILSHLIVMEESLINSDHPATVRAMLVADLALQQSEKDALSAYQLCVQASPPSNVDTSRVLGSVVVELLELSLQRSFAEPCETSFNTIFEALVTLRKDPASIPAAAGTFANVLTDQDGLSLFIEVVAHWYQDPTIGASVFACALYIFETTDGQALIPADSPIRNEVCARPSQAVPASAGLFTLVEAMLPDGIIAHNVTRERSSFMVDLRKRLSAAVNAASEFLNASLIVLVIRIAVYLMLRLAIVATSNGSQAYGKKYDKPVKPDKLAKEFNDVRELRDAGKNSATQLEEYKREIEASLARAAAEKTAATQAAQTTAVIDAARAQLANIQQNGLPATEDEITAAAEIVAAGITVDPSLAELARVVLNLLLDPTAFVSLEVKPTRQRLLFVGTIFNRLGDRLPQNIREVVGSHLSTAVTDSAPAQRFTTILQTVLSSAQARVTYASPSLAPITNEVAIYDLFMIYRDQPWVPPLFISVLPPHTPPLRLASHLLATVAALASPDETETSIRLHLFREALALDPLNSISQLGLEVLSSSSFEHTWAEIQQALKRYPDNPRIRLWAVCTLGSRLNDIYASSNPFMPTSTDMPQFLSPALTLLETDRFWQSERVFIGWLATTLLGFSRYYSSRHEYSQSSAVLNWIEKQVLTLAPPEKQAIILQERVRCYLLQGDAAAATRYAGSFSYANFLPSPKRDALISHALALLLAEELPEALEKADEYTEVFLAEGEKKRQAQCLLPGAKPTKKTFFSSREKQVLAPFFLGNILVRLGRIEEARQFLKTALPVKIECASSYMQTVFKGSDALLEAELAAAERKKFEVVSSTYLRAINLFQSGPSLFWELYTRFWYAQYALTTAQAMDQGTQRQRCLTIAREQLTAIKTGFPSALPLMQTLEGQLESLQQTG